MRKFATLYVILFLCLAAPAAGQVLSVQGGALPLGDTNGKHVGISYTDTFWEPMGAPDYLVWEAGAGAWNGSNYFNSSYTGYASLQIGFELQLPHAYLRLVNGPAYITDTGERLGTHFQLHTKAGAGLETDSLRLGVTYSHFSNGGLGSPNLGRDYVGAELGFKF